MLEIGPGISIGAGIGIGPDISLPLTNTWTWDLAYIGGGLTPANNNNTVFSANPGFPTALGTTELSAIGLVMFSVTLNYDYDSPHEPQYFVGIGNHSSNLNNPLGGDTNSFAYGTDGNVYYDNTVQATGLATWGTAGDVIDVAINSNDNGIWFRVNGGDWNNNPLADPVTNASSIEIINGPYYPGVSVAAENGPSEFTIEPTARYGTLSGFTFLAGTEGANLMLNLDAGDPASGGAFGFVEQIWLDISGNNNNALFVNGSLQNINQPDAYFAFDGTGSSYATINHSTSMSPTNQISWETWAYSDTPTSGDGDYHWILRNGWEGAPWYHGVNTTGQWEMIINDTGYTATEGPQLTAGWHQIVGTYDGTNIRMYVDGTYRGTLSGTATGAITGYNPANPTIIGGGASAGGDVPNTQFWNGGIGVIKMYDTQLSPAVIRDNFNALAGRYGLSNSFNISPSDFTNANWGGGITPNTPNGYTSDGLEGPGWRLYQPVLSINQGGSPSKLAELRAFWTANGLNTNNSYIFNVTWGPGSTISSGVVIAQFYDYGDTQAGFNIGVVDTNNPVWQTPGTFYYNGSAGQMTTLAGTFNFPATFTLIEPPIQDPNDWC